MRRLVEKLIALRETSPVFAAEKLVKDWKAPHSSGKGLTVPQHRDMIDLAVAIDNLKKENGQAVYVSPRGDLEVLPFPTNDIPPMRQTLRELLLGNLAWACGKAQDLANIKGVRMDVVLRNPNGFEGKYLALEVLPMGWTTPSGGARPIVVFEAWPSPTAGKVNKNFPGLPGEPDVPEILTARPSPRKALPSLIRGRPPARRQ